MFAAFGLCIRLADVLQPFHPHASDLQRQAGCPTGHMDQGLTLPRHRHSRSLFGVTQLVALVATILIQVKRLTHPE